MNVTDLKRFAKKILMEKQFRSYEKKLNGLKMTYDGWIRQQEEKLQIDKIIVSAHERCLKNETENQTQDGLECKNEGIHSKMVSVPLLYEVRKKEEGTENTVKFLYLPVWAEGKKTESWIPEIRALDDDKNTNVILFALTEGVLADIALPMLFKISYEAAQMQKCREGKAPVGSDIRDVKVQAGGGEKMQILSSGSGDIPVLVYGDEDVLTEKGREKPWFKPDWSPDTFLSYFYMGSLVALSAGAVCECLERNPHLAEQLASKELLKRKNAVYELCYHVIDRKDCVRHIDEVLYHTAEEGYEAVKEMQLPGDFTFGYDRQDGSHQPAGGEDSRRPEERRKKGMQEENRDHLVSVIIPSKDNPEVLFHCIHSLTELTEGVIPYEIILVDNGSKEENKILIKQKVEALQQKSCPLCRGSHYHYEPMTFNFSRMCNLGASMAKGDLLLFLNDDMEIIQGDWLVKLAEKAVLKRAGAVGAKLLYPDSTVIQHAGITNLHVGPAHKLQFLDDKDDHYYGRNRYVHNMMGVTGACLMLQKEKFEEIGGFYEGLAVAFNDVDLCYTLFEKGYDNIQRNDVVLYHHESLSRGKDGESEEKQLRLLKEKDVLYERHQDCYGKDPYYSRYLTTDMLESEYTPAYHYQVSMDMPWSRVQKRGLPENAREDACVVLGMECAMDIYKWKYGVAAGRGKTPPTEEDEGYYFQGYAFVIGSDNACYKKTLFLEDKETKERLLIPVMDCYRPDIDGNLTDQIHTELTGFAAKVHLSDIPEGQYRFGMLMEDHCSRQKLFSYSSWVLRAGEEQIYFDETKRAKG